MTSPAIFCLLIALSAAVAFPPPADVDACARVRCPAGTRCVDNGGQARCKETGKGSGSEPDQCPEPGQFGICVAQCSTDSDCGTNEKCCSNGCGLTCQTPV